MSVNAPSTHEAARRWLPAMLAGLLVVGAAPVRCGAATDFSRPGAGGPPTVVRVQLFLGDLFEISGADQTFMADVVVLAAWNDPRLARKGAGVRGMALDEVWHPRLGVVNQRGEPAPPPEQVEVDSTGRVIYRQRLSDRFSTRMDLRDFPVDRQTFHVRLVSLGYTRYEVALVPFPTGTFPGRSRELSITDWWVGPTRIEAADYEFAPGAKPLAGIQLTWEGRRYAAYYVVQVILPLLMIVMMGWTALWMETSGDFTRMNIAVTTMLTLIAYRLALGRLVPNLTYLTRFDYLTLGSTVLVFLMVLLVAATAYLADRGRQTLVKRIDAWARVAFPVLFAAVCLVLWRR